MRGFIRKICPVRRMAGLKGQEGNCGSSPTILASHLAKDWHDKNRGYRWEDDFTAPDQFNNVSAGRCRPAQSDGQRALPKTKKFDDLLIRPDTGSVHDATRILLIIAHIGCRKNVPGNQHEITVSLSNGERHSRTSSLNVRSDQR
jgi:hypothetical protein